MTMQPGAIIEAIRAIGGDVRAEGDTLRVLTPKGLPDDLRAALRDNKPALLDALRTEPAPKAGPSRAVARFVKAGRIVTIRPAGCDWPVYLAPGREAVRELLGQGIGRGRIFGPRELEDLAGIPGITAEDIRESRLLDVKEMFGGEIVEVRPAPLADKRTAA